MRKRRPGLRPVGDVMRRFLGQWHDPKAAPAMVLEPAVALWPQHIRFWAEQGRA